MTAPRPWRNPPELSEDLYPGLSVWEKRVSGSITLNDSRLPLWAIAATAVHEGWDSVEQSWEPGKNYGYTEADFIDFLVDLLELRGEFGRLLLVLADAERRDRRLGHRAAWWESRFDRLLVIAQLRRCIEALEDDQ